MVRLQNYTVREGEIVMKISTKYYSMLANRIVEIILSEYFSKSLSLNFQLLCESEIIRQNDECFMKSLIEKVHDAYFQPDYDLQTFVTYRGVCKLCKLYLPAILLERITHQNKMNDSITLLVDHITLIINSKSEEDIEFVCKSSLLDAFLNVCDLENNGNMLDNMWASVTSLNMSEMTEYISSSINRVCSRCPMTTMKWMLDNIDQRIFDMNQLMKRACEFKRLDIVQFLCETINHNQLDFTAAFVAAINNVWNDTDESVSKWLINNIDLQLFDMKQITSEVLEVGCKKDLQFLLKYVDNCMLDIELVFNKLYKKGRRSIESLLKWIGKNVEKEKMNTLEMSNLACLTQDSEVVKYLFNNIDLTPLDVMSILISSINSSWQDDNKYLIQWICLNVDLKEINIINVIDEAFEQKKYDELKILLKNIKENHSTVLRNACKNKQLELIKILLSVVDHDKLNMREAVTSVCVVEKMELLEFFLYNVDHSLYDVHHVLKESCRYGWTHIVKWLLDNIEHTSLDINTAMHTVLHREFVGPDNTLVTLLLQYPIHNKVDVTEIIKECCWWGLLDLVQLICEKNDSKQLDMKEAMNTACSRSHFELVEWLLSNVSNNLLDVPSAFNNAIHANHSDLDVSLVKLLIGNIDHKLIDMTRLFKIGCEQFWYDIVKWVLENADHTLLDVKEEMNIFYDNWKYDFTICCDEEISNRREKYEPLMILILEKVNHNSLDLQKVFYTACHYGALEVVTLVLENSSHEILDMNKAMDIVYENWKIEFSFCGGGGINDISKKYVPLVKLILEKVHHDFLDLNMVLNQACRYGCIEDDDDINEQREKRQSMIKMILEKVDHDLLDWNEIMDKACRYGYLDVVTFLLENTDDGKLDIIKAVNNAFHLFWDRGDSDKLRKRRIL
ncbi:unnamed protein product [Mytilus edulis]|uniref:Ankyrin repeat protein n=1 Tax=Mytilus edulis TaxID=6550 RepID=A0A8S3RJL8_MYTED|nr:unnamed protein product [Mytilus edulis]